MGKSSLANQLLGHDPRGKETLFRYSFCMNWLLYIIKSVSSVGDTAESHTLEISYRVGNWLGSGECFTIIDTPGMAGMAH